MATTEKAKKFSWTDEVTATVVNAYNAKLESAGVEVASSNDHLLELAKLVGAASEKAVRGKLSREGVYQKLDKPASQAKTNKVRKEHIVRAIAHQLGLPNAEDDIDSMKNGKQDHLQLLADKIGVEDVLQTAAKTFERDPCKVVYNFMVQQGIDIADLEDYALSIEAEEDGVTEPVTAQ